MKVVVVSQYYPGSLLFENGEEGDPILSEEDARNDNLDLYNHPRFRRAIILRELAKRQRQNADDNNMAIMIDFKVPSGPPPTAARENDHGTMEMYKSVQSDGLIDFFWNGWERWMDLGESGRDLDSVKEYSSTGGEESSSSRPPPALIPGCYPLPRVPNQRPSKNVMGQIGYYCTDDCTPVFARLKDELLWDTCIVKEAVDISCGDKNTNTGLAYALVTHPGHHAAQDSFGGYCYLNHAACAAEFFQESKGYSKVAVLDIDYHVGNGTASIFYRDPSVLVVSIHCHPDYDYPFHTGFDDETGEGPGLGATLHLPLQPKTTWKEYQPALERALEKIVDFGAEALVLSMGLDTLAEDPCAARRAGFRLDNDSGDFFEMGRMIGAICCGKLPTVVIQEGGYRMDKVPLAAADVLCGFATAASMTA